MTDTEWKKWIVAQLCAHLQSALRNPPERASRRASVLDMLKAFIAANPGCSRQEAAEAIGHGYPYVSRLVQRLVKERVVLDEGRAWGLRMPDAEPRARA